MTTTRTIRSFAERYQRMSDATVELMADNGEHRRYRVTARAGLDIRLFFDEPYRKN